MYIKFAIAIALLLCVSETNFAQSKRKNKKTKSSTTVIDSLPVQAKNKALNDSLQLLKPLEWHTNIFKANEIARAEKKTVFAFFTGSDWCGWCMRLQANVFKKKEFIQWANKNVVLLELDYPRSKQLPEDLAKQNNDLRITFQVQGYPTIWLFNMQKDSISNKINVMAYGSLGYPPAAIPGKEEISFLETANAILEKKAK